MKKSYLICLVVLILTSASARAQFFFDVEVDTSWYPQTVIMPPSPLKYQVLFVGQTDKVQTTATYGNPAGEALAKQWHDFIGFTPDTESEDLGWVSVNHEMISSDDNIGDGGGMTVFKVRRDPITDTLIIVEQTLSDGRSGEFFNVDFVNTVGETGMNCGGITSTVDGRIWTAEEWFRGNNESISPGVRDQSPFTISTDIPGNFAGQTIEKYQNFNWMVEIDPREAKAIRKQYNWGRQPFEGGVVMPDNKTVYTGSDATPGILSKFIADVPGDFTEGTLYAYKHDANGPDGPWVEMESSDLNKMLNFSEEALGKGATMFNRLEWLTTDGENVYMAETGRDNPGSGFQAGTELGGVLDYHWLEPVRARHPRLADKTNDQVLDFVRAGFFEDYYGRVLKFDANTGVVETYLEGGPYFEESPEVNAYPDKHLSNPDGLNILTVNGANYMVINEDLNGTSNARVPAGIQNRTCEAFLLDMSISNPTVEDLVRISVVPVGAEVTGACPTPDGKTLLINSQHPSTDNPFPYNNSLTYAITGWDEAVSAITNIKEKLEDASSCQPYVDPVQRELVLCEASDVAIFDPTGKRLFVMRNTKRVSLHGLSGMFVAQIYGLETQVLNGTKLLVQNK